MKKKNTGVSFWKEESGDISIKGIAITIGIIIIVGLSITVIGDKVGDWADDIWKFFTDSLDKLVGP